MAPSGPAADTGEGPGRFRIMVQAEQGAVSDAVEMTLRRFEAELTADEATALHIVLAEVLNNIVEHAYAGLPPGLISIELWPGAHGLICRVEDQGHPMPASGLPPGDLPDIDVSVPDLPEGGFGWHMIRSLTSDLTYARIDGRNRLELRFPHCPD